MLERKNVDRISCLEISLKEKLLLFLEDDEKYCSYLSLPFFRPSKYIFRQVLTFVGQHFGRRQKRANLKYNSEHNQKRQRDIFSRIFRDKNFYA
jgi:hypothetical protein